MRDHWSLLLTGPIQNQEDWQAAVQAAGWEWISHPLLLRRPLPLDDAPVKMPAWIAITSSGALPALVSARESGQSWCQAPLAAVGAATAAALQEHGFEATLLAPENNAQSLAQILIDRTDPDSHILWLRGERAQDLADQLQAAGRSVDQRIVYSTEAAPTGPAPLTDVIFFAAPEAVELWCRQDHSFRPAAIAIGWTTLDALQENENHFSFTLPLASPTPSSLESALGAIAANQ